MSQRWKRSDLGGGGLQAVNLELARTLRKRSTAYLLWMGFPLGAHRWYLKEKYGALVYCLLSAAAVALAWQIALGAAAFALFDLWWIDRRVTTVNKQLRMEIVLRSGSRGRPDSTML